MPLFDGELENRPLDPSEEFSKQYNHYFLAQRLEGFDPRSASGKIRWAGFSLEQRVSYHQVTLPFGQGKSWQDAPQSEYDDVQSFPFSLSFVTPRTIRLGLARLLRLGAGIFTADFGEAAPVAGHYASEEASSLEHNLYPLRYNKTVSEATRENSGHGTIYARSAWAGSQRYPVHWSGDPEPTDTAMAATIRAGLSLGLCGFSFWSHFIGGFPYPTPPDLYLRWLAFGMLTSHSRCHGAPPTEPWEYGERFTDEFRSIVEMRYRLMPHVYAQAKLASQEGYPMLRPLFFEHPDDPSCWTIEDEYMFGEDLLVGPLVEEPRIRTVYLPPGTWLDYQHGESYEGGRWHRIRAGDLPVIVLVRSGAAIPHVELAQSTDRIDWSAIELVVFGAENTTAEALLCLPEDDALHRLRLEREGEGEFVLIDDPLAGEVTFAVTRSR